jgi:hypothetical protein
MIMLAVHGIASDLFAEHGLPPRDPWDSHANMG